MKLRGLISFGILALISSVAFAGFSAALQVAISMNDDGSGSASGNMLAAKSADNNIELIGCGAKSFSSGGPSQFGFCQALDAEGNYAACITEKKHLMEAMKTMGSYSYLLFEFDSDGQCTRIDVSTQSQYLP